MKWLILIPFALQGLLMLVDEFYFHRKRNLPLWERIGHPIDTLAVLICYLIAIFVPFTELTLGIFVGFAIASCLLITKDEWIHQRECEGTEQWLHSLLFVIHPIVLIAIGILGHLRTFNDDANSLFKPLLGTEVALPIFFLLTLGMFTHQVVYWAVPWKIKSIIKFIKS